MKTFLSLFVLGFLGSSALAQRTLDMKCFKIGPHMRKHQSFLIYKYEGNMKNETLIGGGYFEKRFALVDQSETGVRGDLLIKDFYGAGWGYIIVKYSKKERARSPQSFPAIEIKKIETGTFKETVICEEAYYEEG